MNGKIDPNTGEIITTCYYCSYWGFGTQTSRRTQHVCKKSNKYLPISYKGDGNKFWNGKIPNWCEL